MAQFLGESFLLCCLSFAGSLLLVQLLLPIFNDLINKSLSLTYLMDAKLVAIYLVLLIVTGILTGFYPAVVLSGFSPIKTLYGRFQIAGKNYLQKGLIIFQFTLATFMIIATLVIYYQFEYLTTLDLGYDINNVVNVPKRKLTSQEAKFFSEELMKNPGIVSTAPQSHWESGIKLKGDSVINVTEDVINEEFLDLLKIPIVQGRNFSSQFPSDSSNSVLVNEEFVKMAGWKDPIGQELNLFLANNKKRVVGVVKDYHYQALSKAIGPRIYFSGSRVYMGVGLSF